MKELQFAVIILNLLLEKGIPAVVNAIGAWKVEDPSVEDILKLKDLVKKAEDY